MDETKVVREIWYANRPFNTKEQYLRYRQRHAAQSSKWAKENPHKAHASQHQHKIKVRYPEAWEETDISTAALGEWFKENKNKPCKYCGHPSTQIDHIVPLSKGGSHTWNNIQLICSFCNDHKNEMSEEEYVHKLEKIVEYMRNFIELYLSKEGCPK